MKTHELTGPALDWAVAKAQGAHEFLSDGITCSFVLDGQLRVLAHGWAPAMSYNPSSNWSLAGPIIEREGIEVFCNLSAEQAARFKDARADWRACMNRGRSKHYYGPTPLIAAMRCYCCSRLGDVIDIPEELCQQQNS